MAPNSAAAVEATVALPDDAVCDKPKEEVCEDAPQCDEPHYEPTSLKSIARMYSNLWRYCPEERFPWAMGVACALVNGGALPMFSILFSNVTSIFYESDAEIEDELWKYALYCTALGGGVFIVSFIWSYLLMSVGERCVAELRARYFRAALTQTCGAADTVRIGAFTDMITADMTAIQGAISERVGNFCAGTARLLVGLVIGFYYGWKMCLVVIAVSPVLAFVGYLKSKARASGAAASKALATDGFNRAVSVIGNANTTKAFVQEDAEAERFATAMRAAYEQSSIKLTAQAASRGFTALFQLGVFGFVLWYGSTLVVSGEMVASDVLVVFFSVVLGLIGLGQALELSADFAKGQRAMQRVVDAIDGATPEASGPADAEVKPPTESITFENVKFAYPSRPAAQVLKGLSLTFKAGTVSALVGPSGSGKSTIAQLLLRFYDPDAGHLRIDGRDIHELHLPALRRAIGVVSQEPSLFAGTILDNIRYGRPDATPEEVAAAAKAANAHDFISQFKDGYDTVVGERGTQLSGGQKQRIAIARAILIDPKILLLDEATSALDSESEKVVQEALERLMVGRTCIVIAHRLATIQRADTIFVMRAGLLEEQGTHDELLRIPEGIYADLVAKQALLS